MKLCDTPAGFESAKTLKHQVKTRLGGHFKAYQSSSPGGLMTVMPPDAQQIGFIGRKYHFLWMMAREQQFTGLERSFIWIKTAQDQDPRVWLKVSLQVRMLFGNVYESLVWLLKMNQLLLCWVSHQTNLKVQIPERAVMGISRLLSRIYASILRKWSNHFCLQNSHIKINTSPTIDLIILYFQDFQAIWKEIANVNGF